MAAIYFTTVFARDGVPLAELKLVWPAWVKHRPEILRKPFLFLCSDDSVSVQINRSLPGLPKCYDICVLKVNDYAGWTHREMMLASFVKQAPYAIRTKWMLKLDTDVIAFRQ